MAKDLRFAFVGTSKWAAIACLLAVSVVPVAGAEKITFGLHLKTGQIFNIQITTESNLTQTIMGQEMNVASTSGMGYSYEVQQVAEDGTATCKVTYSTVQVKMSMAGSSFEYDSTKPPASLSPFVRPYVALVGQSFTMRVSPAGRVSEVLGLAAIYEKMLKDLEVPDESMRGTIEQQIKEQFGADAIKENVEQVFGSNYPEKAVDIGDSWVKKTVLTRPYPMDLENTYTLKDRKNGIAVIDIVAKVSTNPAGKPMQFGAMMMTYEFSGERKGQLEIEETTGWTVRSQSTQQIAGTIKVEGGPQGAMSFPISGTIVTRTETKK